jgi:hypothetical protein
MGNGQSQQIGITDLARSKDSFPANQTLLEQADLLGPEGMAGMAAGLGQRAATCWAGPASDAFKIPQLIDLFIAH